MSGIFQNVKTAIAKALVTLAGSGGAGMVGFLQSGAGAVPMTVEDALRDKVSVKQFGAVGDGVADDTAAIQAAINSITNTTFATTWPGGTRVYTKGGGTVLFPPGRYRVTDTILVGQHCKLLGCSTAGYYYPDGAGVTGSQIIADLSNPNKWIIDSANYNSSGNRIGYRDNTSGASMDAGDYNFTHGIEVENLYITRKAGTSAYGGVRLCGSPNSKLRNINVNGTDVGYMVNASWGVTAVQLQSQTYLYGFVSFVDVNGIQIEGYFDAIAGKTIDSSNRLTGMYLDDFNATAGLPDWTNKRFGLLCYYNNATMCNRVITEGWDVARVYVQCRGLSENAMYVERNSDAYFGVVSSQGVFNGMFQFNPSITTGYYFGYNADVTLTGMPVSNIGGTANVFTDIKINQIKADGLGWKHYDKVTYIGKPTGIIRVSATGSTTNIAYDSTYTTLDEALRRIENSPVNKWRVIIKDGETVDMVNHRRVGGKSITFEREGAGSNPTLRFVSSAGSPVHLLLSGDCDVRFQRVNIAYTASSSPSDAFDAAGLFIEQGTSSTISLTFDYMTVDLQTGWYLLQQGYYSASTVQASFINCTINGSNNARIMGGAYGNEGKTNVICSQYATTTAASIKAFGTNGWVNSNVISSNF